MHWCFMFLDKRVHNYKDPKNGKGLEEWGTSVSGLYLGGGGMSLSVARVYSVELWVT